MRKSRAKPLAWSFVDNEFESEMHSVNARKKIQDIFVSGVSWLYGRNWFRVFGASTQDFLMYVVDDFGSLVSVDSWLDDPRDAFYDTKGFFDAE